MTHKLIKGFFTFLVALAHGAVDVEMSDNIRSCMQLEFPS